MTGIIENFSIIGLHGYKDYNINIKENTIIIVGENGAGKTTVLRLFYYLLSVQIHLIAQYKFKELRITIDGKEHVLTYEMISTSASRIDNRFLRNLPTQIRHRIIDLIENNEGRIPLHEIEAISNRYDIPINYLLQELDFSEAVESRSNKTLNKLFNAIRKPINYQLLYLPTYRRIEQELNLILKGFDDDELKRNRIIQKRLKDGPRNNSYIELIEFGMKDVEDAIKNTQDRLKDFARESLNTLTLGYLGDVVDQEYSKVDIAEIRDATEETIKSVLDRIHENILSKAHKEHLFSRINSVRSGGNLDEHAKVICHYFLKLLHFQQDLIKKESQLTSFCNVCNQYLEDKKFIYKSDIFTLEIEHTGINKTGQPIQLKHLSSGEKQIVSLFSHVYLSIENNFFVLIDEPELSLSVPWQRRFLSDIRKGNYCSGLFAVTHSPFIYDNELKVYAHSLGEFKE